MPLMQALALVQPLAGEQQMEAWSSQVRKLHPLASYDSRDHNWEIVAISGEILRHTMGMSNQSNLDWALSKLVVVSLDLYGIVAMVK